MPESTGVYGCISLLRKDDHENNDNVLDIYSRGASERAGKPHTYIYRKWEPIKCQKIWLWRQRTPELPNTRTDYGSRGKNSVG